MIKVGVAATLMSVGLCVACSNSGGGATASGPEPSGDIGPRFYSCDQVTESPGSNIVVHHCDEIDNSQNTYDTRKDLQACNDLPKIDPAAHYVSTLGSTNPCSTDASLSFTCHHFPGMGASVTSFEYLKKVNGVFEPLNPLLLPFAKAGCPGEFKLIGPISGGDGGVTDGG